MSELLAVFVPRVNRVSRVPSATVTSDQVLACIADAVLEHNTKLPQVLTTNFTSSGNSYNLATLVTGWDENYSVREIFWIDGGRVKTLDRNNWQEIYDGTDRLLLLDFSYCDQPTTLYLKYGAPHTLAGSTSTIEPKDLDALSRLAAAFVCEEAAAEAADVEDPTILADSANYSDQASKWLRMASRFRKQYADHVGSRPSVTAVWGEWDIRDQSGSLSLFHNGRSL